MMNIFAGSLEGYKWVEDFFSEVQKDTKNSWKMVSGPLSPDMGVIRITMNEYTTELRIVGEFHDQEIKTTSGKKVIQMELQTLYKGKTIVWEIDTECSTFKIIKG